MQYHLETIPVWEAMEQDTPCPLCLLQQKCEETEIDRSLGGSVMEPDARIRVNERGICAHHHQKLFAMQNRLGHALLVDSHAIEVLKKLEKIEKKLDALPPKRGFIRGGTQADALIAELGRLADTCVICEDVNAHMERYLYTFLHLWKKDRAFAEKWRASKGVCIPHAVQLLRCAQNNLHGEQRHRFSQELMALLKANLAQDEKDLEWFTQKFDYRNREKPWGESKNALERTINRLRGKCVSSTD